MSGGMSPRSREDIDMALWSRRKLFAGLGGAAAVAAATQLPLRHGDSGDRTVTERLPGTQVVRFRCNSVPGSVLVVTTATAPTS